MKNQMRVIGLAILCVAGIALAAVSAGAQDSPDLSAVCREAVEGMSALTRDLPEPESLWQENPVRSESDFDVNEYFSVLDHLSMQEGYVLDYVYSYDFMGGGPAIYARLIDAEPFEDYEAYSAAQEESPSNYLDYVLIDDTEEGYVQFAALWVMGGQFYLFWHANYYDDQIVCDDDLLDAILDSPNSFGDEIPDDVKKQARKLELEPVVEFLSAQQVDAGTGGDGAASMLSKPNKAGVARVQVITFTKWGGFFRATFTIGRDFPRTTMEVESESLVPYDCGVMF